MQGHSASRWTFLIAVAAIGLNLRPFITSIGPLSESIRAATGLGSHGLAMLTFVPMVLMGCLAFLGPALQRIVGARPSVIAALVVICLGTLLRLFVSSAWAMVATAAVIGFGVAVVQAIFPGIIKRRFTDQAGPVMGLYSAMLLGGGALGAQASPILMEVTGSWRLGLGSLALLGLVAAIVAWLALPTDRAGIREGNVVRTLLARRRSWLLMAFFGLGGCFALSMVVALDHFTDPVPASALSALMQGGGFLLAACPPLIVSSLHDLTGGFSAGWVWQMSCIAVAVVLTMRLAPRGYGAAMGSVPKFAGTGTS